jgi:hypothetical protein
MQVNNSSNIASSANLPVRAPSSVQAQEQRTRAVAREENQAQKSQADANAQQRFDIDEQAIALIEREQLQPFNNASQQQSSGSNNDNSRYDAPSSQNQSAVAAYQSVDSIAQRDNIQQVFGVDLFA